jgi:hypothetical protein
MNLHALERLNNAMVQKEFHRLVQAGARAQIPSNGTGARENRETSSRFSKGGSPELPNLSSVAATD